MPRVSLIVAMARNGVIGRDGGLPWHLPEDLRHFKELTLGKPVVMGRLTHISIGRPLPDRPNIVISRDLAYRAPGCEVVLSLDAALARGALLAGVAQEIMVIGGEQVYRAALPVATRIYRTRVDRDVEGDTRFPEIEPSMGWRLVEEGARLRSVSGVEYSFEVLERPPGV